MTLFVQPEGVWTVEGNADPLDLHWVRERSLEPATDGDQMTLPGGRVATFKAFPPPSGSPSAAYVVAAMKNGMRVGAMRERARIRKDINSLRGEIPVHEWERELALLDTVLAIVDRDDKADSAFVPTLTDDQIVDPPIDFSQARPHPRSGA